MLILRRQPTVWIINDLARAKTKDIIFSRLFEIQRMKNIPKCVMRDII
jgi:hypothetical protein